MEIILDIYERSTWGYFLKNDLRVWVCILFWGSFILGPTFIALLLVKYIWLSVIALMTFIGFLCVMFSCIDHRLTKRFPLGDKGVKVVHYSLLEKRLYWTTPRFSKFYTELSKARNDSDISLKSIETTKQYLREIIGVFDNREKIIEAPIRQLRFWFLGIAIAAMIGVTYRSIGEQLILLPILFAEFMLFSIIYIVHALFFDKYYLRQYKIIELYNFLLCAETLINAESANESASHNLPSEHKF
jgi:hypothetical protein